jgi:hypothetical protein
MIHYSCDLCKRELDPQDDVRYVVRMEISQEIEPVGADESDDDRDYLEEMQDMLERLGDSLDDIHRAVDKEMRFDLCPQCARKFVKNPLGRDLNQFQFSKN